MVTSVTSLSCTDDNLSFRRYRGVIEGGGQNQALRGLTPVLTADRGPLDSTFTLVFEGATGLQAGFGAWLTLGANVKVVCRTVTDEVRAREFVRRCP